MGDKTREMKREFDSRLEEMDRFLGREVEQSVSGFSRPESASLQKIFQSMATRGNVQWSKDADVLFTEDVERAQALLFQSSALQQRMEQLRIDRGLNTAWEAELKKT